MIRIKDLLLLLFVQIITFGFFIQMFGVPVIAIAFATPFLLCELGCYLSEMLERRNKCK